VIEQEVEAIEEDIGDLYDNWFIETCVEWAIPYMGDLLDVRALYASSFPKNQPQNQLATTQKELLGDRPPRPRPYGQQERRAYVANTLAYRRRKGTTTVLEQLVRDVTGWRARAIEFSRLLITTQNLNHLRTNSATVDLRNNTSLDLIGTPFEQQVAYTAEVRRASLGGKYNIPNIGIFVWRLQSYPIQRGTARVVAVTEADPTGRFCTFNPLGYDDVPLFNQPQSATDLTKQAQEINLPTPLRYGSLANELKERRQLRLQGKPLLSPRYFNESSPVLQIFVNGQPNPIPPEEILICRLAITEAEREEAIAVNQAENQAEQAQGQEQVPIDDMSWLFPDADSERNPDDIAIPTKVVAVDPELGRIAFLDRTLPERVEVSYLYGFSDDLGGGPYSRGANKTDLLKNAGQKLIEDTPETNWINPLYWEVEQIASADDNPLDTAIQNWNRTVSAWQALRDQIHVPLARVTVSPVQISRVKSSNDPVPLRFKPGIVGKGLEVLPGFCPTEILITPGLAIDRQGRRLQVCQMETFDLNDLSVYPHQHDQFIILVICYRAALQGQDYQFAWVPETAIADDGYPEGTLIPLARLKIRSANSDQRCVGQPDLSVRDDHQRGIVQGLDVNVRPGKLEVAITPGTAVDKWGNVLIATTTQLLNLKDYQGSTVYLVVSLTSQIGQRWQLEYILSEAEANSDRYIRLASLSVPKVKFKVDGIDAASRAIEGLQVNATDKGISIAAGTAKDSQGREINLEQAYQFDLSSYTAQQFVLFISPQRRQGFPLQPIDSSTKKDWQQLGIVPQEPDPADTGIILIKDSLTYEGDLEITIPQEKKLKIIAVDGSRPHICGNVSVQGTAPATEPNQGELILEGLLIEGGLIVLPGYLERLQVIHSTLVPEQGGLWVQPQEETLSSCCIFDAEDPLAAIASVMTVLAFVQGAWYSNLKLDQTPEKYLGQLTQLVTQQMNRLLAEIWQTIFPWVTQMDSSLDSQINGWDCLFENSSSEQETDPPDNSRLEISLYHSICGAITLTEAVPKLSIEDSILDKGQARNGVEDTSGLAILAPGTDTEIFTTTVLGMTTVRSLESSNSLFTEKVTVQLHQTGCIRFSYVPEGSQTPPRYQCQPDKEFQEALDPIPDAITSIASHDSFLFSGSAGGGIFRSINNGEIWEKANRGLSNPYVATTLAYEQAGIGKVQIDSSDPTKVSAENLEVAAFTQQFRPKDTIAIQGETRTVTEIRNDGLLIVDKGFKNLTGSSPYAFEINTVLAGTTGGRIFRSKNNGDDWIPLTLPGVTSTITVLCQDQWAFTGTLIEGGLQIEINQMIPEDEFQVGDVVSSDTTQSDDTQSEDYQTRRIDAVEWSTEKVLLILNAPFTHRTIPKPIAFHLNTLLAATAGEGILRGNANGENWLSINAGLTNLDVRALAVTKNGQVFAGTAGGGVFQMIHGKSRGEPRDSRSERWISLNNGLKNYNISALAIDFSGIIILAGTVSGGVFRFNSETQSNRESEWIPVNQGLSSFGITSLIACEITGTINSVKEFINGQKTFFFEEGLRQGESMTISGRSQKIASIESNTSLTLEASLSSDLPPETPYKSYNLLIAATSDGKLFRSINGGDCWRQLSLDLKGLDVTALAANQSSEQLFAGTAAGAIYCSNDEGNSWQSINAGLPNMIEKLLIMERLQPTFTSDCYGDPGYAQLSQSCANELRTGAEDGAEMGVFNDLKQPQRESNLQANLEEYLRFGLEAGIFYIT
jgi:hypothetical protein